MRAMPALHHRYRGSPKVLLIKKNGDVLRKKSEKLTAEKHANPKANIFLKPNN